MTATTTTPKVPTVPRRIDLTVYTPTAIIAALAVGATISFGGVLSDWTFIVQSTIGAIGALVVIGFAHSRKLLLGESLALSIVAFVVIGILATALVPAPDNIAGFFSGLVNGWADLLSTSPPADPTQELRVLPFTVAWLGAMLGGEVLRANRWPGLGAIGPLAAMIVSLLFSVSESRIAVVQGMAMIAGTIVLSLVQQHLALERLTDDADDAVESQGRARRGLVAGGVIALGIAVVAPIVGPLLPFADADDRFDLRQLQEAPWDPLAVPSPLVELKASLKTNRVDDVVFTVTDGQLVDRWPIAVLNSYNGVVWAVADSELGGNAAFRPVDTAIPPTDDAPVASAANTVEHTIVIGDLGGHWIPAAGVPINLDADFEVRLNRRSGSVASPDVLEPEVSYKIQSVLRPTLDLADLATIDPAIDPAAIELIGAPAAITNLAADITLGIPEGGQQVEAMIDLLSNSGFYDASLDAPPGHSYSRIVSFVDLKGQIKGYEEQYAAAAAVLVRASGTPARVVVGYVVPPSRRSSTPLEVRSGDIAAWVEIKTTAGWVNVDVTPDRSREPSDIEEGRSAEDRAVTDPPPAPPPPDTNPLIQDEESDDQNEPDDDDVDEPDADDEITDAEAGSGVLRALLLAAGVILLPVLLVAALLGLIIWLKVRRERRRRNAPGAGQQIAGAWAELLDRFEESGMSRVDRGTPREAVVAMLSSDTDTLHDAEADLFALTDHVDRAAFHPLPPADADADEAWTVVDNTVRLILDRRTLWQRIRMLANPRLLFKKDVAKAPNSPGPTGENAPTIIDLTEAAQSESQVLTDA